MQNIERTISNINGSMSMEGMPLTEQDKERLRECLSGKTSFDEMVRRLVQKHTVHPN